MNNKYCKTYEEAKEKWSERPVGRAENFIGKIFGKWKVLYRSNMQNNRPYWVCKCECGNYGNIKGSELKGGTSTRCTECQAKKKWKNYAGMKFNKLTVLNEYEKRNGKYYWKCLCECGNITWVYNGNLISGEVKSCGCLSHEYHGAKLEDLIGKNFNDLKVLDFYKYKDNSRVWKCQCKCGNITYVKTSDLTRERVKSCGCRKLSSIKVGDTYGLLTIIRQTHKRTSNGNIIWLCQCECGNLKEVAGSHLIRNQVRSCGCMKRESIGEYTIRQLLIENNIPFQEQQTFQDCYSKIANRCYSFDFYIDNNYIIEFDGIQHFKFNNSGWMTEEKLKSTRRNDLIKNKFCFDNNLPLIRIPYDVKYTINDLKLETTRFLLTPENENEYYESRK